MNGYDISVGDGGWMFTHMYSINLTIIVLTGAKVICHILVQIMACCEGGNSHLCEGNKYHAGIHGMMLSSYCRI